MLLCLTAFRLIFASSSSESFIKFPPNLHSPNPALSQTHTDEYVLFSVVESVNESFAKLLKPVAESIANGHHPAASDLRTISIKIASIESPRVRSRAQEYLDFVLSMKDKPFPNSRSFHNAQINQVASNIRNLQNSDPSALLQLLTNFRLSFTPRFDSKEKELAVFLEKQISDSKISPVSLVSLRANELDKRINEPLLPWLNLHADAYLEAPIVSDPVTPGQVLYNGILSRIFNMIEFFFQDISDPDVNSLREQIGKLKKISDPRKPKTDRLELLVDELEKILKQSEITSEFRSKLSLLSRFSWTQRVVCIVKLQYAMKLKLELDAVAEAANKNPPKPGIPLSLPASIKLAEFLQQERSDIGRKKQKTELSSQLEDRLEAELEKKNTKGDEEKEKQSNSNGRPPRQGDEDKKINDASEKGLSPGLIAGIAGAAAAVFGGAAFFLYVRIKASK